MPNRLLNRVETVARSDSCQNDSLLPSVLHLLSFFYLAGVRARIRLYEKGVLKQRQLPCFVVSIGNITAGGTGKTPMAVYLARTLSALGSKPAVVSRGYRGRCEKEKTASIVSDGSRILRNVREAGDEAFMIAMNVDCPVVVGRDKFRAAMLAVETFDPEVVILDDAFQHLAMERDLDLLLCDSSRPFGNGHLLPRGILREPLSSVKRCDAVILTRCDRRDHESDSRLHDRHAVLYNSIGKQPVFETFHRPAFCRIFSGGGETRADIAEMADKAAFPVSAVADNADFEKTCTRIGMVIRGSCRFPDHYWYTARDVSHILSQFEKSGARFLATTEKDYVKLAEHIPESVPVAVVCIRIGFAGETERSFSAFLENRIRAYQKGYNDGKG